MTPAPSRRRILVVAEQLRRPVPGGVGRSLRELLRALARLDEADGGDGAADDGMDTGVDVTLWASRAPGPGADPLAGLGWPVVVNPLPGPLLTRLWDRGMVAPPEGFDVVHAGSMASPPSRTRRGARRAARSMTVHDLAWRQFPEATTRRGARWHEASLRRALLEQDCLVAPSEEVADELRASGKSGRVEVVPWGADHLPGPDHRAAGELLRRLGVEDADGAFLLAVGTLEPRKNLGRLLRAYAEARPRLPEPWPLVVVGPSGWGPQEGPQAGPQEGPQGARREGVRLAGPVADEVLVALYDRARVLAYVPLLEGFGFPPVEALSRGLPTVVSDRVPSVGPGCWSEPVAVRVDPLDVEAVAEGLVAASTDEALRRRLAAAGRAMTATLTWRATALAYRRIWEDLG